MSVEENYLDALYDLAQQRISPPLPVMLPVHTLTLRWFVTLGVRISLFRYLFTHRCGLRMPNNLPLPTRSHGVFDCLQQRHNVPFCERGIFVIKRAVMAFRSSAA